MKLKLICLCCMISIYIHGFAQNYDQDFEEFMKNIEEEFEKDLRSDSNEFYTFMEEINHEYLIFIEETEKEFTLFLKTGFENYKTEAAEEIKQKDKPVHIPEIKARPDDVYRYISDQRYAEHDGTDRDVFFVPKRSKAEDSIVKEQCKLIFFDQHLTFTFDAIYKKVGISHNYSGSNISELYAKFLHSDYTSLLKQCIQYKNKYQLNDRGYLLLIAALSETLYNDKNLQYVFSWFLLLQSNYKVRIGYNRHGYYLLYSTVQNIYQKPWIMISGERYYIADKNPDSLYTYHYKHYQAVRNINLYQDKPMLFNNRQEENILSFSFNDIPYKIKLLYNPSFIQYYKNYPQTEIINRFTPTVSSALKESVVQSLNPCIIDKTQYEAIDFLLQMVQKGIPYQTDEQQFGHEKIMFPDEILHYPYADCDDKSVFLAYLIGELMDLEIIALDFKDHVCLGVHVTDGSIKGSIQYRGKSYVICDPTYSNAPPGLLMPPYTLQEAKIFDLKEIQSKHLFSQKVWKQLKKYNTFPTNQENNVVQNSDGSIYATGMVSLNTHSEENSPETHAFIAKMNENMEQEWLKQLDDAGISKGLSIGISATNDIWLLGYRDRKDGIEKPGEGKEKAGNYILTRFDNNGKMIWSSTFGPMDNNNLNAAMVAKFTPEGKLLYLDLNANQITDGRHTVFIDEDNNCILSIIPEDIILPVALNVPYHAQSDFDLIPYLVEQNNALIDRQYPPSVSLLFTLFNFFEKTGAKINGENLHQVIKETHRELPIRINDLNENIKKIELIEYLNGMITLSTEDQKPITLNEIMAEDRAMARLNYWGNQAKMSIIQGVKIGNPYKWYNVNYILFDKYTGEIIYDYDNHYQKKLPVHSEIIH